MIDREHIEAANLMQWVVLHQARWPALRWFHHIPNGGARGQVINGRYRLNKAAAGKLKAEGVRRGVSDYFLPHARGGYHGLYIELKAKGGRPTPEQRQFLEDMRAEGYRAELAVGWETAKRIILEYLEVENVGDA